VEYPVCEGIETSVDDRILTIRFARPERQNSFTPTQGVFIGTVFGLAERDDDVRAIVLTGTGPWFSAGADLREVDISAAGSLVPPVASNENLFMPVVECSKPLIASVNGGCAGGGLGFALCCDLRIASSNATFATSFLRVGLTANDGVAYFLPRIVGVAKALELIYTPAPIGAAEAERIGLVSYVVEPDHLEARTRELALAFAATPPYSARLSKRMVIDGMTRTYREHVMAQEYASLANRFAANHDIEEGVAAFRQKRPADFRGTAGQRTFSDL
jgi:2-(1,2-epoxy-1,2-dihydrophenyl)acetyl-CoA isomerase